MTDFQQLAERYIATWNETDQPTRRKLIDELWAEEGRYTDPLVDLTGREAIDGAIGAVQAQFPGFVFTLGPVDAHHHVGRFTWLLGPAGEEALIVGFDAVAADGQGRITSVLGFLDRVPGA
ncbi:polyketide cyclase [Kitasatospora sp. MMS16-BH015]|uniref:nuclear transport factor 2 family protein n=1 Tax=Kitasatospora sp. MMS16-BH015 TaxID=2018025 RepID=UPI000CA23220|nr:nuclear transport factor 2 family protein [Kitasatospora sp. MMS16-BH015]AUG78307.1 polyketide cyclase [Kitasatospora sp. MMS16-BH015]